MTKSTITREESIHAVFDLKVGYTLGLADIEILKRVARMALATMDNEPVVPDEIPKLKDGRGFKYVKDGICYSANYANGWNACRATMLNQK